MPKRTVELETDAKEVVEGANGGARDQKSFAQAVDAVGAGSVLGYRLEQQAALSNFGMDALKSSSIPDLLEHAAKTAAIGMRAGLSKILEFRSSEQDLLVRAGVGWRAGVVGKASFAADIESPAGYAFQTGSPVISNHLEGEEKFRTPALMIQHGVKRAINVLITYGGGRWGILEVDSSSAGEFEAADLAFLQGLANIIGVALDRQAAEDRLSQALEYLAILSSILTMKANSSDSESEAEALGDASHRVIAVARTHDRLWREAGGDMIDLGALLKDVCANLTAQLDHIDIQCTFEAMVVPPDHAVSFALLLTELVSNAAKHAYNAHGGVVHVQLKQDGSMRLMEVKDEGVGLRPDFNMDISGEASLGMNLIQALAQSVEGCVEIIRGHGVTFQIWFKAPLD
jgi:two-component sensor histidine kinase